MLHLEIFRRRVENPPRRSPPPPISPTVASTDPPQASRRLGRGAKVLENVTSTLWKVRPSTMAMKPLPTLSQPHWCRRGHVNPNRPAVNLSPPLRAWLSRSDRPQIGPSPILRPSSQSPAHIPATAPIPPAI